MVRIIHWNVAPYTKNRPACILVRHRSLWFEPAATAFSTDYTHTPRDSINSRVRRCASKDSTFGWALTRTRINTSHNVTQAVTLQLGSVPIPDCPLSRICRFLEFCGKSKCCILLRTFASLATICTRKKDQKKKRYESNIWKNPEDDGQVSSGFFWSTVYLNLSPKTDMSESTKKWFRILHEQRMSDLRSLLSFWPSEETYRDSEEGRCTCMIIMIMVMIAARSRKNKIWNGHQNGNRNAKLSI